MKYLKFLSLSLFVLLLSEGTQASWNAILEIENKGFDIAKWATSNLQEGDAIEFAQNGSTELKIISLPPVTLPNQGEPNYISQTRLPVPWGAGLELIDIILRNNDSGRVLFSYNIIAPYYPESEPDFSANVSKVKLTLDTNSKGKPVIYATFQTEDKEIEEEAEE
jgi:hypothetical protein